MPKFWDRLDERVQENASGILGTIAFHMFLVMIFLIIKISTERNKLENLIMVDFEEVDTEEQAELEAPDPEFEQRLADFLDEPGSNIPVNLARQIDQEISTEEYVKELEEDLERNRTVEEQELQERLRELEEMERANLIVDGTKEKQEAGEPYQGPTTIYYELKNRYQVRMPVPVYKCEGGGLVEVKIAVDRNGRVVQAEIDKPGDSAHSYCLEEAARTAAMNTRFNADNNAPVPQVGSIIYHFIAQ